jgi:hypothetical protein
MTDDDCPTCAAYRQLLESTNAVIKTQTELFEIFLDGVLLQERNLATMKTALAKLIDRARPRPVPLPPPSRLQ